MKLIFMFIGIIVIACLSVSGKKCIKKGKTCSTDGSIMGNCCKERKCKPKISNNGAVATKMTCQKEDEDIVVEEEEPVVLRQIRSVITGKCVEIRYGSQAENAIADLYDCLAGSKNELWEFRALKKGGYNIVASHSSKCLTVYQGKLENSVEIDQYTCVQDSKNQIWTTEPAPGGTNGAVYIQLYYKKNYVLTVRNGNVDKQNGVLMELYENLKQENQKFTLDPPLNPNPSNYVPGTIIRSLHLFTPYTNCVAVQANTATSGASLVFVDCGAGQPYQRLDIGSLEDPNSKPQAVRFTFSGKCIAIKDKNPQDGAQIIAADCVDGDESQLWKLITSNTDQSTTVVEGIEVFSPRINCLQPKGKSNSNGAEITNEICTSGEIYQRIDVGDLLDIPTLSSHIVFEGSQKCLRVAGDSTDEFTHVVQTDCTPGANPGELWFLTTINSGVNNLYQIINLKAKMCLTLRGGYSVIMKCQKLSQNTVTQFWLFRGKGLINTCVKETGICDSPGLDCCGDLGCSGFGCYKCLATGSKCGSSEAAKQCCGGCVDNGGGLYVCQTEPCVKRGLECTPGKAKCCAGTVCASFRGKNYCRVPQPVCTGNLRKAEGCRLGDGSYGFVCCNRQCIYRGDVISATYTDKDYSCGCSPLYNYPCKSDGDCCEGTCSIDYVCTK